jgi:hypothetical protein
MISIALPFNSEILFCAAAKNSVPARMEFAIAVETLEGVRDSCEGCAECAEILVLYAYGRKSGVHRFRLGRHELPELALLANQARA